MRFGELNVQEEIIRKLTGTIRDQRVSHAQMFYGPEGSGKLGLAIAYAQYLNCTDRGEDSCGICPSCQQFQKLAHPDLHFIFPNNTTRRVTSKPSSKLFVTEWRKFLLDHNYRITLNEWYEELGIENKQGTINVRDAEEIIHTLSYKSYESEYKVMIVWLVEKLYHAAAPKLLKILEEPPEKTLFILITEDPAQVLPTIASRCLPVRIPRRDAEEPASAEEQKVHYEMFRKWMQLCYAARVQDLIGFAGDVSKIGRERQKSLLQYGLRIARACAAYQYTGSQTTASEEEADFIRKFSPFFPAEKLPQFSELLSQSAYHVERNAHGPTLFLDLSLQLVQYFAPFRR
jgi:DNA polymerase-3 subunit delta'